MKKTIFLVGILACFCCLSANAEDPYRYFTWTVTYGQAAPLGVSQQVILINGQFPGPPLDCVTNDNIIVNVINKIDEPLLITWSGVNQRKSSWQDGVLGTNCPIQPNTNWTYKFQTKDQIGTFTYYLSTAFQRALGGYGAFNINQRDVISKPYPEPAADFTLLITDWYNNHTHKTLRQQLDSGKTLPLPSALLINGVPNGFKFTGEKGKLYKFRVSNVGIATSVNFRIQGHPLTLIEVEGSHTLQEVYESLDVHVGQSVTVLVNLHATVRDYYVAVSSRFTKPILTSTAILHYQGSTIPPTMPLPIAPTYHIHWSMKQARTIRLNLTANAARPNPQGSYHYGTIPVARTLILANSAVNINGKLRYAVNDISYVDPDTPLKLADWYNISGVFTLNSIKDSPPFPPSPKLGTAVFAHSLHDFVEIIFQNTEKKAVHSWHLDGSSFYVVAYGGGNWTIPMRRRYNLVDAVVRHTVQVYPLSWTAILVSLDNKGMWNLRSAIWANRYLGQQVYLRVWNDEKSLYTENDIPENALFCGKARHP